ncbi:photosystem II D1 precursor processing protein PSB27-H2, chloroplastic isoform X1 [Beta vulgaris subsp. vulgaris]|uniref:photosystem II D1 precursor processing protein PSB27-H2, chloroplastic isoform X1 n=1 Tax=Beta vulgaris subsp. vulgaris TaxID=3555 RepID=UPI002548B3BC|nr:photosystem II D1 precursor processing protein PSB27-H2, chloroplastic isoform X1 [Beta vulgaris subsp. vulgaris]
MKSLLDFCNGDICNSNALAQHFRPICIKDNQKRHQQFEQTEFWGSNSSSKSNLVPGKWESHSVLFPQETHFTRRQLCTTSSLVAILTFQQATILEPVNAVDKANIKEDDEGVFGTINSLFDPNEKTKSGKVLPKAYLKSAREVLNTLRESLKENPKDMAKFRRTADAAKESIRDYLSNWRGQQAVAKEESYMELEKVFRTLASFYAKAGPSASLSDEVKSKILHDLDIVEEFL